MASVPLFAVHSVTGLKLGHGMLYSALAILVWVTFVYQLWTMLVAKRTCGMAWRNLRVVDAETHELTFPVWRIFARSIAATASLPGLSSQPSDYLVERVSSRARRCALTDSRLPIPEPAITTSKAHPLIGVEPSCLAAQLFHC